MPRPIRKLLIANRNEIAVRILKAAQSLGIQTVAVYSEADAHAMHVSMADEAYCLGCAASADSYLRIDRLIEVALQCGADAIHPGYGFVSENPALPRACLQAGIVLVGPGEQAMADMADKAQAKAIALQAGLPCIAGFNQPDATPTQLMQAASGIGYPVMIKALAGGGGRGMRLVQAEAEFLMQLQSAQAEALSAFGDDRVMLEKAVINPRHIEIQVLADQHGHAIHLGERDCTVQRRHQKIVEEAPSPAVNPALRARMGEAALQLVRATGYVGAGTVEFLLDEAGEFYFIEMNTRLQVEHGVTELITGVDLVQWQLRIAGGEPLTLTQAQVQFNGHAIQGRLCAEDPAKGFLPQTGPVLDWQVPAGPHIRIDHALKAGGEVSPWYDSMLAKVMVHAPNREQACHALADALRRTVLVGFEHNAQYLQRIAQDPVFVAGHYSTAYLGERGDTLLAQAGANPSHALAVAAVALTQCPTQAQVNWPAGLGNFSSTRALARPVRLALPGQAPHTLRVEGTGAAYTVHSESGDTVQLANWQAQSQLMPTGQLVHRVRTGLNGQAQQYTVYTVADGVWVHQHLQARAIWVENHSLVAANAGAEGQFQAQVKSPMNGKLTRVEVQAGDVVQAGQVLACLEAMKMEHRLVAKHAARVVEVVGQVGAQMGKGQVIIQLEQEASGG